MSFLLLTFSVSIGKNEDIGKILELCAHQYKQYEKNSRANQIIDG
jgi:hypothetical protein